MGRVAVPPRRCAEPAPRDGDLAFLHVHPTDDEAARFAATFPTAGRYRLFLQFKHAGRVHTAAFTVIA